MSYCLAQNTGAPAKAVPGHLRPISFGGCGLYPSPLTGPRTG